jgi:hypothetical protein
MKSITQKTIFFILLLAGSHQLVGMQRKAILALGQETHNLTNMLNTYQNNMNATQMLKQCIANMPTMINLTNRMFELDNKKQISEKESKELVAARLSLLNVKAENQRLSILINIEKFNRAKKNAIF